MDRSTLLWSSICVAGAAAAAAYVFSQSPKKKYFPSPPSEPFLGHLRVFPQRTPWVAFKEWTKEYGDIIYLNIFGQPLIILNNPDDAHELLEKRGHNYSDRSKSVLHGDIGGLGNMLLLLRYGNEFRNVRRWTTQYFNSRESISLNPLLSKEVKIMLQNLLESPDKFEDHLNRLTASTIVKSTYGHEIKSNKDSYAKVAAEAGTAISSIGVVGLTPFDFFPILRFLPAWLPGNGMMRGALKARKLIDTMINSPFDKVKEQRTQGIFKTSLMDRLISEYERDGAIDPRVEELMRAAGGQIYVAGSETSADTLLTFVIMMLHHPEAMRKAQAEIDSVLGPDQLPTLDDRPDLPYVECLLKEVFRFNPALPLGVPHGVVNDDVYKDKVIPAGSMVIANIWGMMRDERHFPDPDRFYPDRFMAKVTKGPADDENKFAHRLNIFRPDDPGYLTFGFGRRACPGRFFADNTAWLVMSNVLAAFDILPPVNPATGKEEIPKFDWIGGFTSKPQDFSARIIPRSEKHAQMVQHSCQQ